MRSAPSERPVGGYDTLLAMAAAIAVNMGLAAAALVGVTAWMIANRQPVTAFDLLQSDFRWVVGLTTFGDAVIFACLWFIARRFTARPFAYFFPPVRPAVIGWSGLSAAALVAIGIGLEWLLQTRYGISFKPSAAEQAMAPTSLGRLAVLLMCCVLFVPMFEEVLFRGFFFGWLKRVIPVWAAVVVSAAVFALVHGLIFTRNGFSAFIGTGEIFVLGALAAVWAAHSKSLWPAFVVHAVNNAAVFTLAFLLPDLP